MGTENYSSSSVNTFCFVVGFFFFNGVREKIPFFKQPQAFKNPLWLTLEEQVTKTPALVSLEHSGAAGGTLHSGLLLCVSKV